MFIILGRSEVFSQKSWFIYIFNVQVKLQPNAAQEVNAQSKPKVSSPAPSKIYGRPGSLSMDQNKLCCDMGTLHPSQDRLLAGNFASLLERCMAEHSIALLCLSEYADDFILCQSII